ncbi:MAG: OmpA family protein [Gammaproteobacteria bacterium]|nr:OmpA family protein [Rhodocyclaceae bacterium]MBU3907686.1 OmpA family protein [Gammaproteobacteria bacterium]MBU3989231.1 OmpA family protein [Gammaproteobacteria bacterium]MBU4004332.1 OmpA family protein [Gammaproteobacteria bacterium]MBU4019741.1 OmpA family protein [Gammaproteobacteria bacterium]
MTYALTKKQMALAVSCALALGLVSGAATAQTNPTKEGYVVDQRGEVAKSGTGLCWRTGYWTPALAIEECDPDLVKKPQLAVAPAPMPMAAVTPTPAPKPAAQRVQLNADTLFDFNKAVLRPAGREALDDFVSKSKDINLEVITAVGHADRFGSDSYNQKLSEQRAAAVKAYLLSKGIEANRIQTEGKGETQPVTKAGDCRGAKSAKVIACLQPDRRVDIEIIGTRPAK